MHGEKGFVERALELQAEVLVPALSPRATTGSVQIICFPSIGVPNSDHYL